MLIGLTGRAGAGKNTAAQCLAQITNRLEVAEFSFADPLKDSLCALFCISRKDMEQWKRSDTPFMHGPVTGPMTMRYLLQRYGTEAHRDVFGQDFWVYQAMERYARWYTSYMHGREGWEPEPCAVFTDVRFPNEAEAIRQRQGVIVEILRPHTYPGDLPPMHASEQRIEGDVIINNDGDVDALEYKLARHVVYQGPRSSL